MGNCQSDQYVNQNEVANPPEKGLPNQTLNQQSNSRIHQAIFNHNAKDRSKLTENNRSKQAGEQSHEQPEPKNQENILPPDINSVVEQPNGQDQVFQESGRMEQSEHNEKYNTNVFDESYDLRMKNQDVNMSEYKNEIKEDIKKFEQNPPSNRIIDLPPFNYGDEPKYPQDFILEMRGAQRLQDGSTYVGEWHQDKIYGIGIRDGDQGKYEGYWVNGVKQGRGRFTFPDGSIYEGEWNNDKSNGIGTYYNVTGTVYNGEWVNDKRHGYGKEKFPSGACYEGEYFDDQRKGEGTFIWQDGSFYKGQFDQNKMNGKGIMTYSDGRIYEGEYKNELMEGKGIFKWSDGRIYDGEYLNDRKHGFGKLINPDGRIYEGYWKNGFQDGNGTIIVGEHIRKGIWVMGKRIKWIH